MNLVWRLRTVRKLLPVAGLVVGLAAAVQAATVEWHIETVDQSGPGQFSSLRIDKSGNMHLAYVVDDGEHYPLKYAFWDHALKRWFFMPVAQGAAFASMVLDSHQRPRISWADFGTMSGSKLHYAYWDGKDWKNESIPINADIVSYYTSIALDQNDNPSISYYEYRGPKDSDIRIRMRVVSWTDNHWAVRTVDPQPGSGKFNGMVADPQGNLYLAYANVMSETAGMRFAVWDGKTWTNEVFDGQVQNHGDYVGYSACIALDAQKNPHIAYMNYSNPGLKYAVKKNGRWYVENVTGVESVLYPDRNSITIDAQGRPYISFYDSARGMLELAHKDGDHWTIEVVDGNNAGATSSVQIVGDEIWISYTDNGASGVKVAHRKLETINATSSLIPPPYEKN